MAAATVAAAAAVPRPDWLRDPHAAPGAADLLHGVCTEYGTFMGMWSMMRSLAVGHLQTFPPEHAAIQSFHVLMHEVIPRLLRRTIIWRSRAQNLVVVVKFTGVRYVRPNDMRSTALSRARQQANAAEAAEAGTAAPEPPATTADRAKNRHWSYCMFVLVNATVTTVNCAPDADLDVLTGGLGPGEEGTLTPEQEKILLAASRVKKCHVLEAPLFKMPFLRGAESLDDDDWPSTQEGNLSAGTFVINGRPFHMHAILVPTPNQPLLLRDNKRSNNVCDLVLRVFAKADDTYRSTATINFVVAKWRVTQPPYVRVLLPYPRQQSVTLFEAFLLVHVNAVDAMMRFMWPRGVPPREAFPALLARRMLNTQAREARARGVVHREQLFSTFGFKHLDPSVTDTIGALHKFQRATASVVAELFPQQGTLEVRTVMMGKALDIGACGRLVVLAALGLEPLSQRDAPVNQRQQLLDAEIGRKLNYGLRRYYVPIVRRAVREQAQGGVMGSALRQRDAQITGLLFRVFTGKNDDGAAGDDLRVQPCRSAPTKQGATAIHSTVSTKGANEKTRGIHASALGKDDLHDMPDGQKLGLNKHRSMSAVWRGGMMKGTLLPSVQIVFGDALEPVTPPLSKSDEVYATRRHVDFFMNPEFMHRAAAHLCADTWTDDPLAATFPTVVLVNRAIVGCLRHTTPKAALRQLLAARRSGAIRWDVSVMPHYLGVEVLCDNGDTMQPLIVLAELPALFLLSDRLRSGALWGPHQFLLAARSLGLVEYLTTGEIEARDCVVALDPYDLRSRSGSLAARGTPFTHMVLHPHIMLFGVTLGRIPFPQLGASPRLVFPAAMLAQAAHMRRDASVLRQGTRLMYAQAMPAATIVREAWGPMLASVNCFLGIIAWHNMQDDALVVKKSFVDRGGLSVERQFTYTTTNRSENWRVVGADRMASFNRVARLKQGDRSMLDAQGVIKRGSKVIPGITVLIQRVGLGKGNEILQDSSILHTRSPSVDDVWTVTGVTLGTEANGWFFSVTLSMIVPVEVGDKLATMYGQKATVAKIVPDEDMPFVASGPCAGMIPDILMHPLALASRRTVGNAVMLQAAATAAARGEILDGTPFQPFDLGALLKDSQKLLGMDSCGRVLMRDGVTGRVIGDLRGDGKLEEQCGIAVGDMPFMRLFYRNPRHAINAADVEARRSLTTGAPLKGRSDLGAPMRQGMLPLHATMTHGAAFTNKDTVDRSSKFIFPVCKVCGLINPMPPFDFLNIAKTKNPAAAAAMGKVLGDFATCKFCDEKDAVKYTELPKIMALISDVLGPVNQTLRFFIEPKGGQHVAKVLNDAKEEALRVMQQEGIAPQGEHDDSGAMQGLDDDEAAAVTRLAEMLQGGGAAAPVLEDTVMM
jgi:hypothetical protein